MQLEQARYLVELYKTLSMTKAAENLFVSQSAISKSLKKLQEDMGVEIYRGGKWGITFTKAGEEIVQSCNRILSDHVRFENELSEIAQTHSFDQSIEGQLRIGAFPGFLQTIFPDIISRFMRRYPKVKLDIVTLFGKAVENYDPEAIDLAVIAWDEQLFDRNPWRSRLERRFICDMTICIAMDANHPLHEKKILEPQNISMYPWISGTMDPEQEIQLAYVLQGQHMDIVMNNDYLDISLEAILGTEMLFATSNLCANKSIVRSGKILLKPVKTTLSPKIGGIFLKDSPKKELINLFLDQIYLA